MIIKYYWLIKTRCSQTVYLPVWIIIPPLKRFRNTGVSFPCTTLTCKDNIEVKLTNQKKFKKKDKTVKRRRYWLTDEKTRELGKQEGKQRQDSTHKLLQDKAFNTHFISLPAVLFLHQVLQPWWQLHPSHSQNSHFLARKSKRSGRAQQRLNDNGTSDLWLFCRRAQSRPTWSRSLPLQHQNTTLK